MALQWVVFLVVLARREERNRLEDWSDETTVAENAEMA
jgi:hypothetical protein